eukprot:m.132668 g.132668  ORF g.132668 m.132668 type:complete len:321 (+) comp17505_c0_seq1:193-1155(+)
MSSFQRPIRVSILLILGLVSCVHGGQQDLPAFLAGDWKVVKSHNPQALRASAAQRVSVDDLGDFMLHDTHSPTLPFMDATEPEETCHQNGASCDDKLCCEPYVCMPVQNGATFEAKCTVRDKSTFDITECYEVDAVCSFDHQCCSGYCNDEDGDSKYTCFDGYYYPEDYAGPVETMSVSQSQDFGELGHQVPVAGLLVVIVALCVVGLLVLPKLMETHKAAAPPEDQRTGVETMQESHWGASLRLTGLQLLGWRKSNMSLSSTDVPSDLDCGDCDTEADDDAPPIPSRDYDHRSYTDLDADNTCDGGNDSDNPLLPDASK